MGHPVPMDTDWWLRPESLEKYHRDKRQEAGDGGRRRSGLTLKQSRARKEDAQDQ